MARVRSPFLGTGMMFDLSQWLVHMLSSRAMLQSFKRRLRKFLSFHMMGGMLSVSKALFDLVSNKADSSSFRENEPVGILSSGEIYSLGRVLFPGKMGVLPSKFLKWDSQFSKRFLEEPPFN